MRTVLLLISVLLIVAGVTLLLVTGLDPLYGGLGLLIAIAGCVVAWRSGSGLESGAESQQALTGGRSFQKPLPPPDEKPKLDRRM